MLRPMRKRLMSKLKKITWRRQHVKMQTRVPAPIMRGNKQIESADDAVASREEVEEQAEEKCIDKAAFEDGISTASAKEYIRRRTRP